LTDLDRDGSSGLLGLDCDDFDAARAPANDDLPDDGVDQNCTGQDASLARAMVRHRVGGPRAPWKPATAPDSAPDVYLITVDALRFDAFHANRPSLFPRTTRWARRCINFSNARANANFTDLSLFSLHTGMLTRHGRDGANLRGAPGNAKTGRLSVPPTLASALQRRGYATEAMVVLHPMRPYLKLGFQRVETPGRRNVDAPPAAEVLTRAARRISQRDRERGLFFWVHLLDLHAPYMGGTGKRDYLRTAASIDRPLSAFLAALPADALVVLTSDHGEAFGEHGHYTHGNTLFDEELRVPLLLCAPAHRRLGKRRKVSTQVGLIDVMPTLLDLTGTRAPYPRHGESLVTHLRSGAPLRSPWVVFEAWVPYAHLDGILLGRWKWIRNLDQDWECLFDLQTDPQERLDRAAQHPRERDRLRQLYFEILDTDLDAYRSWRLGDRVVKTNTAARRPRGQP